MREGTGRGGGGGGGGGRGGIGKDGGCGYYISVFLPGPLTQSAVADRCSCSTDFSLLPLGVILRDTLTTLYSRFKIQD